MVQIIHIIMVLLSIQLMQTHALNTTIALNVSVDSSSTSNETRALTTAATTSTTLSPELIAIKNYAIKLAKHSFTSQIHCKTTVAKLIQAQTSVESSCKLLCMAKGSLWESQHCNDHDFNLLNKALCSKFTCTTLAPIVKATQSPEELKRHRENVMCVIDNQLSSEECRNTAHSQSEGEDDPDRACRTLQSFHSALSTFHCTTEDYNKLYRVICDQQFVPCSPVTSLLGNLTPRCSGVMKSSSNQLMSPGACSFVESQKQQLTTNSVCTSVDYEKLHQIVCSANPSLSQALVEGQRMEKAEEAIKTNLTATCRDVIWPEYQLYSLSQLCNKVNKTGMSLVREKVCTLEDFNLLKATLCIVHREYTPDEQKVRDQLHRLIPTLSDKCKTTMEEQERQMQESTVEEACTKLKASHEALLSTSTCSEEEITKINKLVCNRARSLHFNWVIFLASCLIVVRDLLLRL